MKVKSLSELREVIDTLNKEEVFPVSAMRVPRGKSAGTQVVALPQGFLDDRNDMTPPEEEAHVDGG